MLRHTIRITQPKSNHPTQAIFQGLLRVSLSRVLPSLPPSSHQAAGCSSAVPGTWRTAAACCGATSATAAWHSRGTAARARFRAAKRSPFGPGCVGWVLPAVDFGHLKLGSNLQVLTSFPVAKVPLDSLFVNFSWPLLARPIMSYQYIGYYRLFHLSLDGPSVRPRLLECLATAHWPNSGCCYRESSRSLQTDTHKASFDIEYLWGLQLRVATRLKLRLRTKGSTRH